MADSLDVDELERFYRDVIRRLAAFSAREMPGHVRIGLHDVLSETIESRRALQTSSRKPSGRRALRGTS